jgi:hypothetical protein
MQTLNVGAGQTDEEYKAAEDQRRADLHSESQTDAFYFFVAAGLAGLATGLLPVQINFLFSIGVIDLLALYGRELLRPHPLLLSAAAAAWVVVLVGLGVAARKGYRWAYWAGMVLYAVDMIALTITFSFLSIGVHGFFVLKWFQGQRALRDLKEAVAASSQSQDVRQSELPRG